MALVASPIFSILGSKLFVVNNEKVFCVLFFCGFCEVERSGDDDFVVYDHDLIVRDGVGRIDSCRNAGIGQEISGGVFVGLLASV
jgi:hypothetical protein